MRHKHCEERHKHCEERSKWFQSTSRAAYCQAIAAVLRPRRCEDCRCVWILCINRRTGQQGAIYTFGLPPHWSSSTCQPDRHRDTGSEWQGLYRDGTNKREFCGVIFPFCSATWCKHGTLQRQKVSTGSQKLKARETRCGKGDNTTFSHFLPLCRSLI